MHKSECLRIIDFQLSPKATIAVHTHVETTHLILLFLPSLPRDLLNTSSVLVTKEAVDVVELTEAGSVQAPASMNGKTECKVFN